MSERDQPTRFGNEHNCTTFLETNKMTYKQIVLFATLGIGLTAYAQQPVPTRQVAPQRNVAAPAYPPESLFDRRSQTQESVELPLSQPRRATDSPPPAAMVPNLSQWAPNPNNAYAQPNQILDEMERDPRYVELTAMIDQYRVALELMSTTLRPGSEQLVQYQNEVGRLENKRKQMIAEMRPRIIARIKPQIFASRSTQRSRTIPAQTREDVERQQKLAMLQQSIRNATGEAERKELGEDLKALLTEIFESDLERRDKSLEELEARVQRLRGAIEKRRENRERIINLQSETIMLSAEGLAFPDSGNSVNATTYPSTQWGPAELAPQDDDALRKTLQAEQDKLEALPPIADSEPRLN